MGWLVDLAMMLKRRPQPQPQAEMQTEAQAEMQTEAAYTAEAQT
jgi:hypothetical protein